MKLRHAIVYKVCRSKLRSMLYVALYSNDVVPFHGFAWFSVTVHDIYLYLKRGHARDVIERGSHRCTPPTVRICQPI